MDFREPVSDARRNCLHPGLWVSNHFKTKRLDGHGLRTRPKHLLQGPARMGGQVNSVGAGESVASFEEASLSAVRARETTVGS